MKKRLRKKLHLSEFREDIFGVRYFIRDNETAESSDEFLWRFLGEAIEANGLCCGGGHVGPFWEFYVQSTRRGGVSEGQRSAVGAWLAQQAEVTTHVLGDLFDGWHGPDEAPWPSGSPSGGGEP